MAARRSYLLVWVLVVCELATAGYRYVPDYGDEQGARILYSEHTAARRFPADSEDTYMHFISPLNFDAINGHIVVGVADALLLLGQNLSFVGEFPWSTMPQYQDACETGDDDTEFACRNHIRVYERIPANEDLLFVCGTQAAEAPQCRTVNISDGVLGEGSNPIPASEGIISYFPEFPGLGEFRNADPSDTTYFTAGLFDGPNNVGQHFSISYQSINFTNPSNSSTLEITEKFRTIDANNYWLRYPVTFVDYYKADYEPRPGSANPDEYKFYFVFLRENIFVANKNPDDVIYSRVVRICQNDRGTDSDAEGSSFFRTYMKARIFCERRASLVRASLGEFNYRYNILNDQDGTGETSGCSCSCPLTGDLTSSACLRGVAFNEEGRYEEGGQWVKMLYGAFSVPLGEGVSSAICAYPADATENNNGVFGVFSRDIIRAGETSDEEVINTFFECAPEGRDEETAKSEVIIASNIEQIGPDPLVVFEGLDITQVVVDRVCVVRGQDPSKCVNQDVLFLGTSTSKVRKVVFVTDPVTDATTPVIAEEISLDNTTVIHMELKEVDISSEVPPNVLEDGSATAKFLFVNTMSRIYRLPLESCSRYESCRDCISSRDPYCVWSTTMDLNPSCQPSTLSATADAEGSVPDGIHQNVHTGTIAVDCLGAVTDPGATDPVVTDPGATGPGVTDPVVTSSTGGLDRQSGGDSVTETDLGVAVGVLLAVVVVLIVIIVLLAIIFVRKTHYYKVNNGNVATTNITKSENNVTSAENKVSEAFQMEHRENSQS